VAWVTSIGSIGVVGDGLAKTVDDYPASVIEGRPDQIAARVRDAVAYECTHEADTLFQCSSCDDITARVLAALGIPTEARDG
jgi:hypothetical protein